MTKNDLINELTKLRIENEALKGVIQGMIDISDLWIPVEVLPEHVHEAEALHSARQKMLNLLTG